MCVSQLPTTPCIFSIRTLGGAKSSTICAVLNTHYLLQQDFVCFHLLPKGSLWSKTLQQMMIVEKNKHG